MYHSPTVPSYLPIVLIMHSSFSTKTLPSIKSYTASATQAFCQIFPRLIQKTHNDPLYYFELRTMKYPSLEGYFIGTHDTTHTKILPSDGAFHIFFFKITPLGDELFFGQNTSFDFQRQAAAGGTEQVPWFINCWKSQPLELQAINTKQNPMLMRWDEHL